MNLDDIDVFESTMKTKKLTSQEEYQEILIFNNAVREIFMNRFVQLFSGYEAFVIQPSQVSFFFLVDYQLIDERSSVQKILFCLRIKMNG